MRRRYATLALGIAWSAWKVEGGDLSPYDLARIDRVRLERGPVAVRKKLASVTRLWVVGYAASDNPGRDIGVVDQVAKARGLRLIREYRFDDVVVHHYG